MKHNKSLCINLTKIIILIKLISLSTQLTVKGNSVKDIKNIQNIITEIKDLKNLNQSNTNKSLRPNSRISNKTTYSNKTTKKIVKIFNLLSNLDVSYEYYENQKINRLPNSTNFILNITKNFDKKINAYLVYSPMLENNNSMNQNILLKNLTISSENFTKVEKEINHMINSSYCLNKTFTIYDVTKYLKKILTTGFLESLKSINYSTNIFIYKDNTLYFKNVLKYNNKSLIIDVFHNYTTSKRITQNDYNNSLKVFSTKKPLFNFRSISTNITQDNNTTKLLENPCYFEGFIDKGKMMKGSGNFKKCYKLLYKIFNGNKSECIGDDCANKKKNQTSILLGDEFKDIATFLNVGNITLGDLKIKSKETCEIPYNDIVNLTVKNLTVKVLNSICFRLTYTIVLIEKILENDNALLLFATNQIKELQNKDENQYLLSSSGISIDFGKITIFIRVLSCASLFIYIIISLFKHYLSFAYEKYFLREIYSPSSPDYKLLDSVINSLAVKNYTYSRFLNEIRLFCQKEIFLSFNEYRLFFYHLVRRNPELALVVNDTLKKRNQIKASNILTIIQIIFLICLGYCFNQILTSVNFDNKDGNQLLYTTFSIGFSVFLAIHFLKLIMNLEMSKYYRSEIITNYEKKYLYENSDYEYESLEKHII